MSSSSSLSEEDRARAEAYADAECDRVNPRSRLAYRHTVLQRVIAEIIDENNRLKAYQAQVVDEVLARVERTVPTSEEIHEAVEFWLADPAERKAARERGLLLARMEAEQGVDASWR